MELKYNNNDIIFTIKSQTINGIICKNIDDITDILRLRYDFSKDIKIDGKKIKENDINEYKSKISIVRKDNLTLNNYNDIYTFMIQYIKSNKIYPKNTDKKIKDSLKIVGLNQDLLNRNINDLSNSEKELLKISVALLSNPELLIIEDPMKGLDLKNQKKLIILFKRMIEQYNKTIVFISTESETIYKYCDEIIVFTNTNVIQGKTKELINKIELLEDNNISIPEIVEFTYLVRKIKDVKIDYYNDIRDIIKDIYKHK